MALAFRPSKLAFSDILLPTRPHTLPKAHYPQHTTHSTLSTAHYPQHTITRPRALLPDHSLTSSNLKQLAVLTMAFSCELLACVMPRMLVVCITSTEKLGSQLAIRDPKTNQSSTQELMPWSLPHCHLCIQTLY